MDVGPRADFCVCCLALVSYVKHRRQEPCQELAFFWELNGFRSYVYAFNPLLISFCEWRRMGSKFILLRVVTQCSQQHLFYVMKCIKVTLVMTLCKFQGHSIII